MFAFVRFAFYRLLAALRRIFERVDRVFAGLLKQSINKGHENGGGRSPLRYRRAYAPSGALIAQPIARNVASVAWRRRPMRFLSSWTSDSTVTRFQSASRRRASRRHASRCRASTLAAPKRRASTTSARFSPSVASAANATCRRRAPYAALVYKPKIIVLEKKPLGIAYRPVAHSISNAPVRPAIAEATTNDSAASATIIVKR